MVTTLKLKDDELHAMKELIIEATNKNTLSFISILKDLKSSEALERLRFDSDIIVASKKRLESDLQLLKSENENLTRQINVLRMSSRNPPHDNAPATFPFQMDRARK